MKLYAMINCDNMALGSLGRMSKGEIFEIPPNWSLGAIKDSETNRIIFVDESEIGDRPVRVPDPDPEPRTDFRRMELMKEEIALFFAPAVDAKMAKEKLAREATLAANVKLCRQALIEAKKREIQAQKEIATAALEQAKASQASFDAASARLAAAGAP